MTCPEDLTLSLAHAAEGGAAGRPATLDLLLPGQLPAEISPTPQEAALIAVVLPAFLRALEQPQTRAARCRALLAALGDGGAAPAQTGKVTIPAKPAEIEDFDRYFDVRRVASESPALPLLRGLLQTASAVFTLSDRAALPPSQIERQRSGFAAHARLLARICNLDAPA